MAVRVRTLALLFTFTTLFAVSRLYADTYPAWTEGSTYKTGDLVTYSGSVYQALVYQTDYAGAGWNPAASPTLWKLVSGSGGSGSSGGGSGAGGGSGSGSSGSGLCSSIWSANKVYTGGMQAGYAGVLYKANWWTEGDEPDTHSGPSGSGEPWTAVVNCDGTALNPGTGTSGGSGTSMSTVNTINFHLLLGVGSPQDTLSLGTGNYTDLIQSNMIAGVMYGHLLQQYMPGLQFNKDYLYGSLFGQLLQENIETELYKSSSSQIDPSSDQQAVMGVGQGGPYQINNYAADMNPGTPGYALIDYDALRANIGYTLAGATAQASKATPASFNNKYFGPMLTAYFHFDDFKALANIGAGSWTPGWQPAYGYALVNFKTLPDNFLDVLLNAAYNQGYYGPLVTYYSKLGANATGATVASVNSYASVWGSQDTYQQYPYQVRYYLDQLYNNPIPTTSPNTMVTPSNHVSATLTQWQAIFTSVFTMMSYKDPSGNLVLLTAANVQSAFSAAVTNAGLNSNSTLDLSTASDRARIFSVLEQAIQNLESSLGIQFSATSSS
jgi:chitodextrinase